MRFEQSLPLFFTLITPESYLAMLCTGRPARTRNSNG